jgi:hypothetical protein
VQQAFEAAAEFVFSLGVRPAEMGSRRAADTDEINL